MAEKKVVYTLAIDDGTNTYPHEVTDITLPFIKHYARKIGAVFYPITQRRFPDWPITYEKHQIWELGSRVDWNIFIDADALISPDLFDVTAVCPKDHVMFTGKDMSAMRFRPDRYALRDGRFIGACTWFVVSSDWTHDLWMPLDIKPEAAYAQIFPTAYERKSVGIKPPKLIEDYSLSRNIARFGLKHLTIEDEVKKQYGRGMDVYYYHQYTIGIDQKVLQMQQVLQQMGWSLPDEKDVTIPVVGKDNVRHITVADSATAVDRCVG